jgi:hypothetical protein
MIANIPTATEFTVSALAKRWGLTSKTALRHIAVFGLKPFRAQGMRPIFALADVEAMEAKRQAAVAARLTGDAPKGRVISLTEARDIAARKRKLKVRAS